MGRGLDRPNEFQIDPAHDNRSVAHETRALYNRPAISVGRPVDLKGLPMCCPVLKGAR